MIRKAHAAFGYALVSQSLADGETYIAEIKDTPEALHFWVQGGYRNRNLTTGEPMPDFVPGTFLRASDYYPGQFEHTAIGDTLLFCYSITENRGYLPPIEKLAMAAGEAVTLPAGTKLFLCAGEMSVNGNAVSKPTQIRSAANALAINAVTDCYGLIFG
jgi:hypothetical protein